jgi:glycosyltransferase involved in cell wall biosynthesis
MKCDVLLISGTLDYNSSVSGNYILYKILKKVEGLNIKVLPIWDCEQNNKVDAADLLPYIDNWKTADGLTELVPFLPEHKILFLTSRDLSHRQIYDICTSFGSKICIITMSHWLFGETQSYPEIYEEFTGNSDFYGNLVNERARLFHDIKTYIIAGSTNSYNVLKQSQFYDVECEIIPFPFEEIDVDVEFKKEDSSKKIILWGTTQPDNLRKGKKYFENILEWLYKKVDNPNDILIYQIGPESKIETKFDVQYIGYVPNRKELSKVYKNSDVFALTTLADAGPMMAVECIKNETPLVSFATNISTDVIRDGKNGYIVDGTEEYADKLYDILYNKNFHIDLDYVRKFNSEEIVMKQYNNFFKKILK